MNKIRVKDIIVVGFALFAMFLGAGNLILPPTVGYLSGIKWPLALLGFIFTGVGFPVLGIIAMARCDGKVSRFAGPVSPKFAKAFGIIIMLIIGPIMAIPRTAATTYEIGIAPFFPNMPRVVFSLIFFAVTLFFVLSPGNVIDRVGKILTPMLLTVLGVIIFKAVFSPIAAPVQSSVDKDFLRGFEEGYQTMDALGSMILATIVIANLTERGYKKETNLFKVASIVGVVATGGLALVYGGLTYMGATGSGVFENTLSRTELLVAASHSLWGNMGRIALAISIALACLTTAVGLTTTAGDYFSKVSRGKLSYRAVVIATCVVSIVLSIIGVDGILKIAAPILAVLYPVAIVLIVMNVFRNKITNKYYYLGATIGTLMISVIQGIVSAKELIMEAVTKLNKIIPSISPDSMSFDIPIKVLMNMPFKSLGFPWLLPAIVMALLVGLTHRSAKGSIFAIPEEDD